ncbi:hypothetical protein NDU88_006883 [Pleurodeles waltl]|uniref:Uncharacterized protein n=1 Tax=Pleurodeles waltl TaxID=8319 RepID=A0AAV7SQU7_PLEWA|nr:hypothetical protein NDU88_006883 [Pleurodeles waltl]
MEKNSVGERGLRKRGVLRRKGRTLPTGRYRVKEGGENDVRRCARRRPVRGVAAEEKWTSRRNNRLRDRCRGCKPVGETHAMVRSRKQSLERQRGERTPRALATVRRGAGQAPVAEKRREAGGNYKRARAAARTTIDNYWDTNENN